MVRSKKRKQIWFDDDAVVSDEFMAAMDARIKYASDVRVLFGFVPLEKEMDSLFPVPDNPGVPIIKRSAHHFDRKARSYGIYGITPHRKRWMARIERRGIFRTRYFMYAIEAATWFNETEQRIGGEDMLLCCTVAAEMVDSGELPWAEVVLCRKGRKQMDQKILNKIEERLRWARHDITN